MSHMFRRRRRRVLSPTGFFYIVAPGELSPLFATMPGGPGEAELAEDGLHFGLPRSVHHFSWTDIGGVEQTEHWIRLHMQTAQRYIVEVHPGQGMDRWMWLLVEKHGVVRLTNENEESTRPGAPVTTDPPHPTLPGI